MSYFSKFPKTEYNFFNNGGTSVIPDLFRQARVLDSYLDGPSAYQFYTIQGERPDQLSQKLYNTPEYYWTFFLVNDNLREGMNAWPMTQVALEEYIDDKYTNKVLRLYRLPEDTITFNSIANIFPIGSTITGNISGTTAEILDRYPQTNQLVFKFTSGTAFDPNDDLVGVDINGEEHIVLGKYEVRDEKNAVHHFEDSDGVRFNNTTNELQTANIITFAEFERQLNDERSNIRVIRSKYIEDFGITFRRLMNE